MRLVSAFCCLVAMSALHLSAERPQVQKLETGKDLFQCGEVFIAGQPSLETLRWLKGQGVGLVINLRTESENKDFAATAFQEEALVKGLGMDYVLLPVGKGDPRTLEALAKRMEQTKGKTLIHCATGRRATHLWMAYVVSHRGWTLDEAAVAGRKMKFDLLLEDFLGGPLSLRPMAGQSSKP